MSKKSLSVAVSLLALAAAAPAAAGTGHDCIDESCSMVSLIAADDDQSGASGSASVDAQRFGTWGIDLAGMDGSVKPGDDFFAYVNGNWAKTTSIPADRSSYGAFAVLRDLSEARLRQLVETYPAGDPATGGDQAKVAALYRGFMDEAAAESQDALPLLTRIAPIYQARTREDLATLMGRSIGGFGSTFFGSGVSDDAKNPEQYALYMGQSGLGLGDRDLYLDAKFKPQKDRYFAYVAQMLEMAGWPSAKESAAEIVALETRIAEAHWTRAESRNRDKTYNPMTLAQLQAQAPGFPWRTYWQAAGLERTERAVVSQVTAIPKLARIFAETDLQTLKAWQIFHTADDMSPLLSKRFGNAQFEFRSKFLNGQPQQRDRWKRGIAFAETAMGEAIGRDYVALYFKPDAKAKMDRLVTDLRAAMKARLERLEWMGPETKVEALKKLANFGLKIGYPDKWRDYSELRIVPGDLVGNAERASRFEWDYRRGRIELPVDKAEWGMTPQTVNAYYSSVKNEIVFPAAILQPPFFDPDADPAVNYGAIGGVIAHEITHGFDDQGSRSDAAGNLRNWWTAEDRSRFNAKTDVLVKQFDDCVAVDDLHVNGRLTLGENIADLGGLTIAYAA
ncbi:MAG: M13 family metallopeptidase, partial [Allosphingosinicella sp.]